MIKFWLAAGSVALMAAIVSVSPAASAQELLAFGKGKPVPAGDAARGQNIFNAVCWACHNSDLTGGRAPPLTGSGFFQEWQGKDAKALADFIQNRMPQDDPGALSERGARNVVAYIVTYANRPESVTGGRSAK